MGREADRAAIFKLLKNHLIPIWGPVSWPNVPFSTPQNTRWLGVQLLETGDYRQSLGDEYLLRAFGTLQVDVFSPRDIGSRENRETTDALEDVFRDLVFLNKLGERIEFSEPTSRDLSAAQERQEGTENNWFRRVFEAPYSRDSYKTKNPLSI